MAIDLESKNSAPSLEERLVQLELQPKTERVEHCLYCKTELNPKKNYQYSSAGGKYCNKNCFDLFTDC